MNVLNKTRCYLAGSMENSNGQTWREKVKQELSHTGIKFFDPYNKPFIADFPESDEVRLNLKKNMAQGNYSIVSSYMKKVRAEDLRIVDISDFAIVFVHPKIASWGTGEELTTLNREKKPIFVFIEGSKKETPLWIMGMIPHKYIYNSIEEVISMITSIDSGNTIIDSDRWRLLKPEYL